MTVLRPNILTEKTPRKTRRPAAWLYKIGRRWQRGPRKARPTQNPLWIWISSFSSSLNPSTVPNKREDAPILLAADITPSLCCSGDRMAKPLVTPIKHGKHSRHDGGQDPVGTSSIKVYSWLLESIVFLINSHVKSFLFCYMAFHTYLCTSRICLAYFCVNDVEKGVISFSLKEKVLHPCLNRIRNLGKETNKINVTTATYCPRFLIICLPNLTLHFFNFANKKTLNEHL